MARACTEQIYNRQYSTALLHLRYDSTKNVLPLPCPFLSTMRCHVAKQNTPSTNGSYTRVYQWCSHLENACKVASVTASLLFQPLLVVCIITLTSGFDFQHRVSYECYIYTKSDILFLTNFGQS